jgi:hypothetical protein
MTPAIKARSAGIRPGSARAGDLLTPKTSLTAIEPISAKCRNLSEANAYARTDAWTAGGGALGCASRVSPFSQLVSRRDDALL